MGSSGSTVDEPRVVELGVTAPRHQDDRHRSGDGDGHRQRATPRGADPGYTQAGRAYRVEGDDVSALAGVSDPLLFSKNGAGCEGAIVGHCGCDDRVDDHPCRDGQCSPGTSGPEWDDEQRRCGPPAPGADGMGVPDEDPMENRSRHPPPPRSRAQDRAAARHPSGARIEHQWDAVSEARECGDRQRPASPSGRRSPPAPHLRTLVPIDPVRGLSGVLGPDASLTARRPGLRSPLTSPAAPECDQRRALAAETRTATDSVASASRGGRLHGPLQEPVRGRGSSVGVQLASPRDNV